MKQLYASDRVGQRFAHNFFSVRAVELLALLSLFVMLSACTPTNQLAREPHFPEVPSEPPTAVEHSVPDVENQLRTAVAGWAGTPYVLGGTTARGIDCSAFVQKIYGDALNLQLPRTTREQVHSGTAVQRRDLRPGDLVFFKPPSKTQHVGIFLNDGEFAHASSSQGVTISDLDQDYWDQSYWTSRRILLESARPAIADRTRVIGSEPLPYRPGEADSKEPKRERIGW